MTSDQHNLTIYLFCQAVISLNSHFFHSSKRTLDLWHHKLHVPFLPRGWYKLKIEVAFLICQFKMKLDWNVVPITWSFVPDKINTIPIFHFHGI